MNKLLRLSAFVLLAISLISGSAYAAVTHTDGDIYGDAYTVENSSGNWTLAGSQTVQGNSTISGTQTITGSLTVSGATSGKRNVTVIASTANTIGTVTLAKSGYMFVLDPTLTVAEGGVSGGYVLTLPSTNSTVGGVFTGEQFTFSTATSSTLSIRCASATDATIAYGQGGTVTKITSPASSGSTVTVVGKGGKWYIASMSNGNSATSGGPNWTSGTF